MGPFWNTISPVPYDVIIPARNEEQTVDEVVRVAREAREVGSVIVIDDHSTDGTADAALRAAAEVITSRSRGDKGSGSGHGRGSIPSGRFRLFRR